MGTYLHVRMLEIGFCSYRLASSQEALNTSHAKTSLYNIVTAGLSPNTRPHALSRKQRLPRNVSVPIPLFPDLHNLTYSKTELSHNL